jgi:hypothetical protein
MYISRLPVVTAARDDSTAMDSIAVLRNPQKDLTPSLIITSFFLVNCPWMLEWFCE